MSDETYADVSVTFLAQYRGWGGEWRDDGNIYSSARDAREGCIASLTRRGYSGVDVRVLQSSAQRTLAVVEVAR